MTCVSSFLVDLRAFGDVGISHRIGEQSVEGYISKHGHQDKMQGIGRTGRVGFNPAGIDGVEDGIQHEWCPLRG